MGLQFNTIPKTPKNKVQVVKEHKIIGYIDYANGFNQYHFVPAFDMRIGYNDLFEIATKMNELNNG